MILKQSKEKNIRADSLQVQAVIEIGKFFDIILSSLLTKYWLISNKLIVAPKIEEGNISKAMNSELCL
jgi:hypothetical protein